MLRRLANWLRFRIAWTWDHREGLDDDWAMRRRVYAPYWAEKWLKDFCKSS